MQKATIYEHDAGSRTTFSFGVEIEDSVWELTFEGTLPQTIPAVVSEPPDSGAAKILSDVLEAGTTNLGPVKIVDPPSTNVTVPLKLGDKITIEILGRLPETSSAVSP